MLQTKASFAALPKIPVHDPKRWVYKVDQGIEIRCEVHKVSLDNGAEKRLDWVCVLGGGGWGFAEVVHK